MKYSYEIFDNKFISFYIYNILYFLLIQRICNTICLNIDIILQIYIFF